MTSLLVGDTWVDPGCIAIDNVDGAVTCTTQSGSVNTSVAGSYDITYYAIDAAGNSATLTVTIIVRTDEELVLSAYYFSASGLSGTALLEELRVIINTGLTRVTYDSAKYILDETDQDPNNPNNLILVYLGTSVSGTWDAGVTWNREHVWSQSLLGVDTNPSSKHVGSDLHNLKPANPSENSSRGNKYFDNVTTTVSYAPRDEVKGDVARILFYMVVMYDYLTLQNRIPNVYEMAWLNTLLTWHENDPVDDFERNRNEVIYTYQSNRNPFIDYPEFVGLIGPTNWNGPSS